MQKASERVSHEDRTRITQAVSEAESRTSAEIVPVLATTSGRYDRPEDIIGVWSAAGAVALVWSLFARYTPPPTDWGTSTADLELPAILIALVVGYVIGAFVGSNIDWLRALFVPTQQMRDEVDARARAIFFDGRVHHTAGATGVLIFVSLFERMTAVIADKSVLDKLGQQALDEICTELDAKLRSGGVADALCAAVKLTGDKLGPVLKRESDDVNELADALICLD